MNKTLRYYFIILLISLLLVSCSSKKEHIYTIGFSQCTGNDLWRKQMINEMKIEASFYDNIRLIIEDANGNSNLQVQQIKSLINKKVDLLIISPNESEPITPVAVNAFENGIPTILIDRKINSDKYSAFIGADNYAIGKYAAMFLGNLVKEKAEILEIWGLDGSSPAQERHKGFINQLKLYPNLSITGTVKGMWTKQDAFKKVLEINDINRYSIIFGHNDVMALGAYEAFLKRNVDIRHKIFVGVDALKGKDGGIQNVIDKKLNATLMYQTGGGKAIQVAYKILCGQKFEKEYKLNTAIVDNSNAEILQLQSIEINDYMDKIETQLRKIVQLDNKFNNQTTLLYFSIIFMLINFLLAILLFAAYHHTRRIYNELKLKNDKIIQQREELSQQREQLVIMNNKIEEVSNQKLRFFTNISHEFRTPLSLIISPLERIIEINKNPEINREIVVMKNNVDLLLRLISQLLDFRKIEDGKLKLFVKKTNIVNLIKNIKIVFNYQATIKEINYILNLNNIDELDVYIDNDKIEKVLLNVLSNAFKFSKKNGTICIELIDHPNEIEILISDSGKGMDSEQISKIFEQFYQGKEDYNSGTGIGLNLAKEYIEMHQGYIEVNSEINEGSSFSIHLKKGIDHLNQHEISFMDDLEFNQTVFNEKFIENEVTPNSDSLDFEKGEHCLLIVEDNVDMCLYLKNTLNHNYTIYTAFNGVDAFQVLKDNSVSLIVCDVLMPEMDGFEFCCKIKNDIAYSHIPVILLTALTGEENLINGLQCGADDYLYKPFNVKHLELKIRNLILFKRKLRDSFIQEFLGSPMEIPQDSMDKTFLKKVTHILEMYICENDISIEKISNEIGMSRVHLYRKIKELTGSSPSEFFKIYKIKKSLPLLKAKNMSISEIAYSCGFSSPAYYSKCFKDVFNISPSDFQ